MIYQLGNCFCYSTGKSNYIEVQKRISKSAPGSGVDIVTGANANSLKACLLVGLGFWLQHDLYRIADISKAPEQVDKITEVINFVYFQFGMTIRSIHAIPANGFTI